MSSQEPSEGGSRLPEAILRLLNEGYLEDGVPDLNLVPINRAVTFDTNAYRVLTHGLTEEVAERRIGRLRHVERLGGIQAFAHPWVTIELCGHLESQEDPAFPYCLAALRAQYQHCVRTRPGGQLAMLADPESQLCYSLYGEAPPDLVRRCLLLGEAAKFAFENPDRVTADGPRDLYADTASMARQIEGQWVQHLRVWVLQRFLPGAEDWDAIHRNPAARRRVLAHIATNEWFRWLAKVHVGAAILRLQGGPADDPTIEEKVTWILEEFSAPFHLYTEVVRGIVISGGDPSRHPRVNAVTDMQLAFSVGPRHTLAKGVPLALVTGDRAIINAARAAGCDDKVMILEDYLKIFPPELLL